MLAEPQQTLIYAAFACLGKTTFAQKYPNLAEYLETSTFDFPQNYLSQLAKIYNRKGIIFIPLSPEILSALDAIGIKYTIVYPEKNMLPELIRRSKNRGNSQDFINIITKNLTSDDEINSLKENFKPKKVIYAKGSETLEEILQKDPDIKNISLYNSGFTYKDVHYSVEFHSLINKKIPEKNWTQVYVVGNFKNKVPVVIYNKKGKGRLNLPGGGTEDGENFEQTLRREIIEELNMDVVKFQPLGYQINIAPSGEKFYQLRVVAELQKKGDFLTDVGGSVVGYKLVDIKNLNNAINWGEVGDWFSLVLQEKYE
ncbi:MAG: NUDIX hydrolase [bacterium]|nr:NUDIX hydrolase [bacterium]